MNFKQNKIAILCTVFLLTTSSFAGSHNPTVVTNEQLSHAVGCIKDNEDNFQFAVIGDRTGGERMGVFVEVIKKLNLINSAFVVSTGDSIQGYSRDPNDLERQWDEFDAMTKELRMPFLRAIGNHDITNYMQEKYYKERYGRSYYHFIYRNVLFLFVCMDDPNTKDKNAYIASKKNYSNNAQISDEQLLYFKKVLEDMPNVRWTFVLMHKRVWKQENPPDNWLKLEKLLGSRRYTVFGGHDHYHECTIRNNNEYIGLGTAGAALRKNFDVPGVYDHLLLVTMNGSKPEIANILINGIKDGNDIQSFNSSFSQCMAGKQ